MEFCDCSVDDLRSSLEFTETEDDEEKKDEDVSSPKIHRVRSESFTISSSDHDCDMTNPVVLPANLLCRLNHYENRRNNVTEGVLKKKLIAAEQRRSENIQQIVESAKEKQERCNKIAEELDLRAKRTMKKLTKRQQAAEERRSEYIKQVVDTARVHQEHVNAVVDQTEDKSKEKLEQLKEKQAAAETRRLKNFQKRAERARVCQKRCHRIAAAFQMMCRQQEAIQSCQKAPYNNCEVQQMLGEIQSDIDAVLGRMTNEINMAEETLKLMASSSSNENPLLGSIGCWSVITNSASDCRRASDSADYNSSQPTVGGGMEICYDDKRTGCLLTVGDVEQPDLPGRLRSRLESYNRATHRITQADLQKKLEAAERRREKFFQKRKLSNNRKMLATSDGGLDDRDEPQPGEEEEEEELDSQALNDLFQIIKSDILKAMKAEKGGKTILDLKWRLRSSGPLQEMSNQGSSISLQIDNSKDIKLINKIKKCHYGTQFN